jgi:hypothetical protein
MFCLFFNYEQAWFSMMVMIKKMLPGEKKKVAELAHSLKIL